jgi:hypothetical protein
VDSILQSIEDWFRELLVSDIMSNLTNKRSAERTSGNPHPDKE